MKKYMCAILSAVMVLSAVVYPFGATIIKNKTTAAPVTVKTVNQVATGSAVTTQATTTQATTTATETTTEATSAVTEPTTEVSTIAVRPRTPGCGHLRRSSSYVYTKYNVYTTTEETTEESTEETTEGYEEVTEEAVNSEDNSMTKNVKVSIGSSEITIGNESYEVDAMPYIQYTTGSTLVPLRFVALAVSGGDVDTADGDILTWDGVTKTAIINYNGKVIAFTAGSSEMIVNSDVITMANGASAEISGNRIYIPFRALGDALGVDVDWDSDTKTATYIVE